MIRFQTEKESEFQKDSRKRVCRSTNPCARSTGPVYRHQPRLGSFQSVDRFHATVDQAIDRSASVHLVHTGRSSGQPSGRPVPCIGRPGGLPCTILVCCMRHFSPFDFQSLCYLLTISVLSSDVSSISSLPTILHLSEDFSNLSRSPTNSSLSPDKIDT